MKKGSLVGVIPMLIILLTSSLFAVQSINIANAMADEAIESVENLGKVVEGGSSSGRYFYDHLTKGATYSINQKSYDLGQKGGGVEWSNQQLSLLTTTQVILHERANNYLTENYVQQGLPSTNCQIQDQEFNILLPNPNNQVDQERQHIAGSVESSLSEVKTNCQFENSRLQQQATQGFYKARYNASYNRYFQLANDTTAFYKDVREEWENTDVDYTASSTQCGEYPSEEEIEEDAREKAAAAYGNALSDVAEDYPTIDGAEIEVELTEVDYEVTDTGQSTGAGCDCEQVCSDSSSNDDDDSEPDPEEEFGEELGGDPSGSGGSDDDEDVGTGDTSTSTGFFFQSKTGLVNKATKLLNTGYQTSEDLHFGNKIQAAYITRVQDGLGGEIPGAPDDSSSTSDGDDGSDDFGREDGDQVDGDPDSGDDSSSGSSCSTVCDKNERTTEVSIKVNEVHAESTITDTKYRVLVNSGWENLEFHVEDYNQEVESSGFFSNSIELGTNLLGQANEMFQSLVSSGSTTTDFETWIDERRVYENTRFDVEVNGEEDEEGMKFQIKLGEKKNLPGSTDTIYFFDQQEGFFNNLHFRAQSGTSSALESCEGSVISGRPLSEFALEPSKCSYSGVGNFESGDKTIGICDYEQSSETAYLAVLEDSATASDIQNTCSGETTSTSGSGTESSDGFQTGDTDPGGEPEFLPKDQILERPYDPLKRRTNAAKPVNPPECDSGNSEVEIIEPGDNLESTFEDESKRIFCVTPGDYRNGGFTIAGVSGTEEKPRWIRYYNPDNPNDKHPWNMADPETKAADNRVIMDGIRWTDSNHWIVDRIRFDSKVETWSSHNFIFNQLMMYRSEATVQMKLRNSDYNTVQNSVLGKTASQDSCGSSDDSNGITIRSTAGKNAESPYIVNNEIFDTFCGDGIQYSGSEDKVFGGVIQGNHIYRTEGYEPRIENAIDLKMGPADNDGSLEGVPKEDWIIVENNILQGDGMNLIYHHEEASGIVTRDNIMMEIKSDEEFAFRTFPKGTGVIGDWHFYDNIIYDTSEGFLPRQSKGSFYARNIFVDVEAEDKSAFRWYNGGNEMTRNVFVNSDVKTNEQGNDVTENAYYNSEVMDGTNPPINENNADAAQHDDLEITIKPITGPETKTLPGVKVTESSPHSDWFP